MSYVVPETFTFEVKPTKRYRIVFSIWGHTNSDSISDFDTIEELNEEEKMIKEFYNSTPRPEKIYEEKNWRYEKRKYRISFENGGSYWGYIALDYQEKKILEIYNDGCRVYKTVEVKRQNAEYRDIKPYYTHCLRVIDKKTDRRRIMDLFFRTEEDVPSDYVWDNGEYEGWLQFKWGDGKNAIGYVEPKKEVIVKDKDENFDEEDEFENYVDKNEEIATTIEEQLHEEMAKRLRDKWYDY